MRRPWSSRSLAAVYGQAAAERLAWLETTAGYRACQKFVDGKIGGSNFSGQYVIGICGSESGRRFICELLDHMKEGRVIALYDIESYCAHGKRRPLGMRLIDGQLIDVWNGQEQTINEGKS